MTVRIRDTSKTLPRIRDTGNHEPGVDSEWVAAELGAVKVGESVAVGGQSPPAMFAIRQEMAKRLTSTGGRPGLQGNTRRQKIPLSEDDWNRLKQLSEVLLGKNIRTTPGQVASVLIHQSLQSIDRIPSDMFRAEERPQDPVYEETTE